MFLEYTLPVPKYKFMRRLTDLIPCAPYPGSGDDEWNDRMPGDDEDDGYDDED